MFGPICQSCFTQRARLHNGSIWKINSKYERCLFLKFVLAKREKSAVPFMLGQIALITLSVVITIFIRSFNVQKTIIALFSRYGKCENFHKVQTAITFNQDHPQFDQLELNCNVCQ